MLSNNGKVMEEVRDSYLTKGIRLLCLAIALYHVLALTIGRGVIDSHFHRILSLMSFLILGFLAPPHSGKSKALPLGDMAFLLLSVLTGIYFIIISNRLIGRYYFSYDITNLDIAFGTMLLFLIFESTRRFSGITVLIITIITIGLCSLGSFMPGTWRYPVFSYGQIIDVLTLSDKTGAWGIPVGVTSTYITIFLIFGGLLNHLGGGQVLNDLCLSLTGNARGGPAKVAVLSSAFVAMVTGGGPSNVAITGVVTIPMMKKTGYKPHFAGAVESVASTASGITPPVMGITAFMMSEMTGIPYVKICAAAIIPAVLYVWGVLLMVHFEAVNTGLKGLSKEELIPLRKVFIEGGELLLPIGTLILMLIIGYDPINSGVGAIATLLFVSLFRKRNRIGMWQKILMGIEQGLKGVLIIIFICSCAGMMIDSLFLTGLITKFTYLLSEISAGSIFFLLILAALLCIFLGMVSSLVAAYLITVLLVIPILNNAGIPIMVSHMFAIHMSNVAFFTPPIAVACYVAASISGANFWRIGWTSMRLGIPTYIVPFIFVYWPSLLLIGSPMEIILETIRFIIAFVCVVAFVQGCLLIPTNIAQRVLLFLAGAALFFPIWQINSIGLILLALVIVWQKREMGLRIQDKIQ